jgi:hypothetical protein
VYRQRQLRIRVLDALEQRLKQFPVSEDLWPLRVPHEPLVLEDLVGSVLGDERTAFDPAGLASRTLLHFAWEGGATWDAWVIVLPSKLKLYCDTTDDESRILASAGKNEGDESDRIFLQLLARSGGRVFGIEMAGGPPARVRSAVQDHEFLVDVFVDLFEVLNMEPDVKAALCEYGIEAAARASGGADFRHDVEQWLTTVLAPGPPKRMR